MKPRFTIELASKLTDIKSGDTVKLADNRILPILFPKQVMKEVFDFKQMRKELKQLFVKPKSKLNLADLGFEKKAGFFSMPNFTGKTFIQGALDARRMSFPKVKKVPDIKPSSLKIPSISITGNLEKAGI